MPAIKVVRQHANSTCEEKQTLTRILNREMKSRKSVHPGNLRRSNVRGKASFHLFSFDLRG